MQSLKDDAQHRHSTFLEYAIVLLIAFEVFVEMHAIGWIDWPEAVARACAERRAAIGRLRFPRLRALHMVGGLLHELKFGGLEAFYKKMWEAGLAAFARKTKKKGISKKVEKYSSARQHFWFVHEGAMLAQLHEHAHGL